MTKEIELTKGQVALVDDDLYPELSQYKWHAAKVAKGHFYAARNGLLTHNQKTMYMHRLVIKAMPGEHVDHINGNGLDNRRSNLRVCTRSQNLANSGPRKDHNKGVFSRPSGKWGALITVMNKQHYLGQFSTEDEARLAYNKAALEHFGEFAYLNDIPQEHSK